MKKYIVLIAVVTALSSFSFAQQDSTVVVKDNSNEWKQNSIFQPGNGKLESGFYGALMTRYGQIDGNGAFLVGGKGAWIINHSLGIGIAGNGLMSRTYTSPNSNIVAGYLGGNGGILIEPVLFSDKSVHIALPVVFGGGYVTQYVFVGETSVGFDNYVTFGYIEPGIEIELNVVEWFRVAFGAYYAFRPEVDTYNMKSDIIAPLSLGASFKFGMF